MAVFLCLHSANNTKIFDVNRELAIQGKSQRAEENRRSRVLQGIEKSV
jgi:hypothetical protein